MREHTTVDSEIGPLTLVASDGALSGVYMHEQRHRPAQDTFGTPGTNALFTEVERQLGEYFTGDRTEFEVPLAFTGTPFQQRVWTALCDIRHGETVTYGELAARIGTPTASRAVGLANGRNPISVIVPCHRVIGSTGNLTGYGGGLDRKRFLLEFERGTTPATLF